MGFPEDPLGTRVEFQIGGEWTDVTGYAQVQDIITHTRGRTGEGQAVDPASCTLTLKSPDGLFSPRNPRSPYYGKLGKNTPMRVSLRAGDPYLELTGEAGIASTPDDAALDITGDLDLRWEGEADWYASGARMLIGKWGAAGNRSYHMRLQDDYLFLQYATDGTAGWGGTWRLPALPRRAALRATVSAGDVSTFTAYWAPTLDGPWTQIDSARVFDSPGASVYVGTAPLEISPAQDDQFATRMPVAGRCYRAEVRSGINGTVVAAPDFTAQAPGTTSFVDSAGRTWTLTEPVTDRRVRFSGEYSEWPTTASRGGHLIRVTGEGSGILRRLNQGKAPLQSTLRRRIPSGDPLVYWPMEDGENATHAASGLPGGAPLTLTGVRWAEDDTLFGSEALPVLDGPTVLKGAVPGATAGAWHVEMLYKLEALSPTEQTFFSVRLRPGTGGVAQVRARVSNSNVRVQALDADESVVAFFNFTDASAVAAFTGVWNRLQVFSAVDGATTYVTVAWRDVVADTWCYATTAYTGSPGAVTGVQAQWGTDFAGMAIGHLAVFDTGGSYPVAPGVTIYDSADDGFLGETAAARLQRLAEEENLPIEVMGPPTLTARMGPQRPATLLEQLEQCEAADGGILVENPERPGLRYRPRVSLYNQEPALELSFRQRGLVVFEPVEDDSALRNDVTVERAGGSSGRAELTSGPLSVLDPPDGAGRYDDSVTLNLYEDEQAEPMAYWLLHLGTVDEARYPLITLKLHRAPELIEKILGLSEGDLVRVTDLPDWMPPGPVDLIVQGYTERIGVRTWEVDLVCAPGSPWRVGVVEDETLGRVDTDGSELAAAVEEDDTTLIVQATEGPVWARSADYPSDFPFDIRAGGEVMTVSAVADSVADAFGRTVAAGWGSADSGQAWTVVGTAADYSVGSGVGVVTHPATGIAHLTLLPAPSADVDLYVDVATSALAAGASLFTGPIVRATDNNNHYMARVELTTSATIALTVRKRVSGAETSLGSYNSTLTHTAGTFYRVRFQVIGTALKAKIWAASGREPDLWQIEVTDTSITAANSIGTRSFRNTGNTNTGVEMRFDNLRIVNPQAFTVTRAVNGITKAHTAGTDVRLATPTVIAL